MLKFDWLFLGFSLLLASFTTAAYVRMVLPRCGWENA